MRKRNGKHMELDVSTGWVRRSYFVLAILIMAGSLSASVFVSNGTITYIGADAIITFLRSGSITVVNQTLYNVSFLVVGGGGAGGAYNFGGGGGGGGAVINVPSYTMTPGLYNANVGLGPGKTYSGNGINPARGDIGSSSSFGSSAATGGGGGAGGECSSSSCDATSGSSGGGGAGQGGGYGYFSDQSGAAGTAGGNGANSYVKTPINNGGGGGGSAQNATNGTQPNGGSGRISSITSSNYGGGGGGAATGTGGIGGAGGVGGGGIGGVANSAIGGTGLPAGSDGVNGTGGGGGGGVGSGYAGGAGGSGIVIVKMDASYVPLPGNATGYLDYCNGTVDSATSITWAVYDLLTGNQTANTISSNLQQVYNNTLLVETFTATTNDSANFSLCMFPANGSAYAQTSDTITSSGYYSNQWVHEAHTYSNSTVIYPVYLLSQGNYSKLVQIFVVDNTYTPMPNVSVKIQQISPITSSEITIGTYSVDAFGSTTQGLQPASQLYHFSVLSSNGTVLQDFANKAIPCSSTELICSLVLVVNPNSLPIDITSLTGSCAYYGTTRIITCTGTDTSATITALNISAFAFGNTTAACSTQAAGSSGTLTCTLPNINGTYYGYFFGIDAAGYNHLIATGTYTIGAGAPTTYGRDGWIAAILLVVVTSMLMMGNPAVSIVLGCFGLFVALAFGLIPIADAPIVVLITVAGLVLTFRMKV